MANNIDKYGLEAAAEMSNFEIAHIQAIKNLVENENIDCDFILTRSFDVFMSQAFAKKSKDEFESLVEKGRTSTNDVQFTPAKRTERVSGVKDAKGCASFTAAHFWLYKFTMHLLASTVSKGLNLQTHTPVTHVSSSSDGDDPCLVSTTRGSIKAKNVIFASNDYTAGVLPEYTEKTVPCRGMCCRIVTPNLKKAPYLTNSYVFGQGGGIYDYLISRADGSIIVGAAKATMGKDRGV